jgi:hypothetical protein
MNRTVISFSSLAVVLSLGAGCAQLPGTHEQQGAVIGGTGGYLIGANSDILSCENVAKIKMSSSA